MNKFKVEWDNHPEEMYDKLRSDGWHIHIVNNEVISAISPNADYIYSYCKGSKQELKIFCKEDGFVPSILKKHKTGNEEKLKMWNKAVTFDKGY